MILRGYIVNGLRHFTKRMTDFPDVFARAAGERLYPGTLNVKVGTPLPIKEDFRIRGSDIREPNQDLLFERCRINGIPAYRIRPFHLPTGLGGHGDDTLEISCAQKLDNVSPGTHVEIEFFR